jgi:hypothetical protein
MQSRAPLPTRRWAQVSLWSGLNRRSRERLARELQAFDVEWAAAAARPDSGSMSWIAQGKEHLDRVRASLASGGDPEAAWVHFDAARRVAVNSCTPEELAARAQVLRTESQQLPVVWGERMRSLLQDAAPGAPAVMAAMALRDQYRRNRRHRSRLAVDQLKLLAIATLASLAGFVWIWASPLTEEPDLLDPRLIGSALLMGLLGGALGAARSLLLGASGGAIPERMLQGSVTAVRALFGAASGLGGYLLYESGILQITAGENATATDLLVAFLSGYFGELLVSKIASAATPL